MPNYDDNEVSFEIVEKIGVLSTYSTGWTKEINLVRWNGGTARYDIREWDPHHMRMSKGLTFEEKEMRILIDSMKKRRYSPRQESHKAEPQEEDLPEESLSGPEDLTETIDSGSSEADAADRSAGEIDEETGEIIDSQTE